MDEKLTQIILKAIFIKPYTHFDNWRVRFFSSLKIINLAFAELIINYVIATWA